MTLMKTTVQLRSKLNKICDSDRSLHIFVTCMAEGIT
uniref:Uncharacterized protein n=1 Tax=Arundo donax TaxID=35708 RepID=A0A0A9E4N9_ARUDO